ncbi:hypothetical protein [Olivibacter sitiensis]|uniref:hypothetical protein n=1 Tax=Olivibacter sitiensis TaxID=376470 RepID=UPI000413A25B|nr:hypothetical protein [Olivibacter sitiensis]
MKKFLYCKHSQLPHFLNEEERASPQKVIADYFNSADIYHWKSTLWNWLKCIMTEGIHYRDLTFRSNLNESNAYYDKQLTEKLVEACSLLATEQTASVVSLNKKKEKRKHLISILKSRKSPRLIEIKETLYLIQFLSDEEIKNPHLALGSFFQYFSLDEWRYLLDEWLYHSLSNSNNVGTCWYDNTFYCYIQLVRLTEACFLIDKLENKDLS